MHQMSPGVERAVTAARGWAERLGAAEVRLAHYLLALLDEEEGRPAVLLERGGAAISQVREYLMACDSPLAPPEFALFHAARNWSLAHRHDPEFLTDAFLLAVIRADAAFDKALAASGINTRQLEAFLHCGARNAESRVDAPKATSEEFPPPQCALPVPDSSFDFEPDVTAEVDAARVMDACFNRAREAVRVIEDYCRFVLDDRFLTETAKRLRHDLAEIESRLPPSLRLAARETRRDVGTDVTASGEYVRRDPADIATANCKRLVESLRSLEEFGKLFASDLGRDLETLRYRAYALEKPLAGRAGAQTRLANAGLYLLVTGAQCAAALDWTIQEAAKGGVDVVQLREKGLSDRELLARGRDVRRWTRQAGVLFIMNDRPDIARLVEADGVHLGQDDMSVKDARRIVGKDSLIGRSTHTLDQVREAVLDGADYLGVGPVFPSPTKAFEHFPGLAFVAAAAAETSLPMFALGGITATNIDQVVRAGAKRVAVSSAIVTAAGPEAASRALREALSREPV
jgi:thiamine-phosphate pyrophosphorylase